MVDGSGFVGFVDDVALLVVDGFVGFAGGRWLVIAGFMGSVLREIEREREAILQRGKNKEPNNNNNNNSVTNRLGKRTKMVTL